MGDVHVVKMGHGQTDGTYYLSSPCTMNQLHVSFLYSHQSLSLVPRPHPPREEKGLVTVERFLGFAESAVLEFGKLIKLLNVT